MEVKKNNRLGENLDDYICGLIDGTLSPEKEKKLVTYLGDNPEALRYFRDVVHGKQALELLNHWKAPEDTEGRLALKIALEKSAVSLS